ncbi:autotransporter outer membrane beta-barrel domain-containing protein [Pseudomonas sp. SDI]|uniref:autotransporter outer membrane beta-barrel domain-containing protein n=1 Tax=Pseudomonas sp. SDI TaxID=2170734 RepID=UPI000DE7AB61|nr:autotransporter outer membrane beta-barrel domain-containing protein [Pseudomonas sp. SDI]PWB30543.1 autotransporter outer membrane beta-barrel domain-containing protein [Pseudomonas sp. SDI]
MRKASNPSGFAYVFYAVSTSLLLATPVETHAVGLEDDDPFINLAQSLPTLALNPVNVSGLSLSLLDGFSSRLAERQAQVPAELIASQWAQFFPSPARTPAPASAQLDTSNRNLQISPDLFIRETAGGNTHRAGFFVGRSNLQTGVNATRPALGDSKQQAVQLEGESLGVYWSVQHEKGWHVDAVAMGTRFDANGRSASGERLDGNGHALTFSVEGGFPIGLGKNWVIEPQAQVINQQYYPGNEAQAETLQAYDRQPTWSGRVGAKLSGRYEVRGMPIEPYVRTNVWYDFSNADTVSLDKVDKISSGRNSATVELGLGLVARVTPTVSLFVSADYSSDVDDNDLNGLIGNLGVRMRW